MNPRERCEDETRRSMTANISYKEMQRTEHFSGAKFLWDEGYLLYYRKFVNNKYLKP